MTLKSKPYYWLECDGCGAVSTEGGDFTAWGDSGVAEDEADGSDWRIGSRTAYPVKHRTLSFGIVVREPGPANEGDYCSDCTPPWCLECERPINDDNLRMSDPEGDPDNWECQGCAARTEAGR